VKTEQIKDKVASRKVAYRQLILKLQSKAAVLTDRETAKVLDRVIGQGGYHVLRTIDERGICIVELLTKETLDDTIQRIKQDRSVVFAEPNDVIEGCPVPLPNDPMLGKQWALARIDALAAWQYNSGSPKVLIAVADSGLPMQSGVSSHEDLSGSTRFLLGSDFTGTGSAPADDHGHGSHVAGIAAAQGRNATGIVGLAYTCTTLSIKVLDANNDGTVAWVYEAAREARSVARSRGSKLVFNFSGQGRFANRLWNETVEVLRDVDAVLCAAAGNDASTVGYPAALSLIYDNILAVGATDATDTAASFSNRGPELNLVAPGVGVLSTLPDYPVPNFPLNYGSLDGTSMATPLVSALAAIVWTQYGFMSAARVCRRLEQTALDLGPPGRDNAYGFGRIDAKAALEQAPFTVGEPIPRPQPWPNAPLPPPMATVILGELQDLGAGIAVAEWFVRRGKPLDAGKRLQAVLRICKGNGAFTRLTALNNAVQSPSAQTIGAARSDLRQQTSQEKIFKAPWLRMDALFQSGYLLKDAEWFAQYNRDLNPVVTRLAAARDAAADALIYGDQYFLIDDLIAQVSALNNNLEAVRLVRAGYRQLRDALKRFSGVIDRRP
jgi:hypothetical protein